MGRLLTLLLIAALLVRALTGQWPWQLWSAASRSQDEVDARALLGVGRNASRQDVIDAHRRLIAQVHPDRGGTNAAAHAANHARDVLLARIEREESH
ncbi:MAG: hypothetical protein RIQ99_1273 [Pseudomonadota bacterium]|jgi:hypothetical protein